MSDYVPHTDDVRAAYETRATTGPPAMAADYEEARAEFTRWLAGVRAEALREAADAMEDVPDYAPSHYDRGRVDQRHDMARHLYERADKIEKEGL